jgi:serine/threonine protein kinase
MRVYKEIKNHGGKNILLFCEREDGTKYVIKHVHIDNPGKINEIIITTSNIHPCIINAVSVADMIEKFPVNDSDFLGKNFFNFYMQNPNKSWSIVLPLIKIELINIIKNLSDNQIKKYLIQLASALKALHEFGVYHMDLKLDNILIDTSDNIKLIDFDTSEFYNKFGYVSTPNIKCTVTHRPPEGFSSDNREVKFYNEKFDIWSFGIIAFELYSRNPMHCHPDIPSYDDVDNYTYNDIIHKLIQSDNFSLCVKLTIPHLASCLNVDPSLRPTWQEILELLS